MILILTLLCRDGRRTTETWREVLQPDAARIGATDRPLVGNSVVRVWRTSRLPHTLATTQTDIWDTVPTQANSVISPGSIPSPALRAPRPRTVDSTPAQDANDSGSGMISSTGAGGADETGSGSEIEDD